ncbi:MAG: hypothetical protein C5B50_24960 [Verrucomicrobia bacterium]|nr:MAG: hypothetical protein C5B50_24960 [Verrucomicrobiota bacterium]
MPGVGVPFAPNDPRTREAAAKGAARVREMAANGSLRGTAKTPPYSATNTPFSTLDAYAQEAMKRQLTVVREQIKQTRAVLNASDGGPPCPKCGRGTLHPRDRAQLVKALDALLDRERKLLNVPEPGRMKPQHKPVSERRGPTIADIAACLAKPNHSPSPAL